MPKLRQDFVLFDPADTSSGYLRGIAELLYGHAEGGKFRLDRSVTGPMEAGSMSVELPRLDARGLGLLTVSPAGGSTRFAPYFEVFEVGPIGRASTPNAILFNAEHPVRTLYPMKPQTVHADGRSGYAWVGVTIGDHPGGTLEAGFLNESAASIWSHPASSERSNQSAFLGEPLQGIYFELPGPSGELTLNFPVTPHGPGLQDARVQSVVAWNLETLRPIGMADLGDSIRYSGQAVERFLVVGYGERSRRSVPLAEEDLCGVIPADDSPDDCECELERSCYFEYLILAHACKRPCADCPWRAPGNGSSKEIEICTRSRRGELRSVTVELSGGVGFPLGPGGAGTFTVNEKLASNVSSGEESVTCIRETLGDGFAKVVITQHDVCTFECDRCTAGGSPFESCRQCPGEGDPVARTFLSTRSERVKRSKLLSPGGSEDFRCENFNREGMQRDPNNPNIYRETCD
ncbi:MAG: hypothetical protein RL885_02490 [Planctomycetota bacterium]